MARDMFPTHVGIARGSPRSPRQPRHVPYACGDCAARGLGLRCWTSCSLRMWGLRDRADELDVCQAMFPTHVGIARNKNHQHPAESYVPYACGDCADAGDQDRLRQECSLRMWGLRVVLPKKPPADAMFPTHVGIARVSAAAPSRPGDVPYACGDCASEPTVFRVVSRCSLRMWGLRGLDIGSTGYVGMFPTHVGIARHTPWPPPKVWHVPYACGDCAIEALVQAKCLTCSLRMWGLRGRVVKLESSNIMFPTHVGIARRTPPPIGACGNVPYACGDCAAA